jgi:hypothetical protein
MPFFEPQGGGQNQDTRTQGAPKSFDNIFRIVEIGPDQTEEMGLVAAARLLWLAPLGQCAAELRGDLVGLSSHHFAKMDDTFARDARGRPGY